MSSEERKVILKMVEESKITAQQAAQLLKALDEQLTAGEINALDMEMPVEEQPASRSARDGDEFEQVRARAQRFASIPLWLGISITLLSAYWLFALVQRSNYGFWFFCAWLPLFFGVLLAALSVSGPNTRWLYVNVDQRSGEWPRHITLGFPLPLGLASWLLQNFGHYLRGMERRRVEEMLSLLATANVREPLIVNVDEGERGERVQVYIG